MQVLPEKTEFAKFLLNMAYFLNEPNDNIELPNYYIALIVNIVNIVDVNIVEDIYDNLMWNKKFNNISKFTILFTRNADVDEINNVSSNY